MILLTKLNGSPFAINPDLIERIHEAPDTTIFMVDGSSYVVTETLQAVVDRIVEHRSRVIATSLRLEREALDTAGAGGESEQGGVSWR